MQTGNEKKLKYSALLALVVAFMAGLGYWLASSNLLSTRTAPPQQHVEKQPSSADNPYQTNLSKTNRTAAPTTIPGSQAPENRPVRKGLIVLLKQNALIDANGALAKYLNMPEITHHKLQHLSMITLIIPEDWELEPIQHAIAQDPAVLSISKNTPVYMQQVTPDDPLFVHPAQWGLDNISAPQAWHYTTGDETVVIAVMDSGVDYTHPDLVDNMWINEAELHGLPFVDDDHPDGPRPCHPRIPKTNLFCDDVHGTVTNPSRDSNDPQDFFNHGTAVASIIAAFGNNEAFSTGVAWRAKILPVVVFDRRGFINDVIGYLHAADYLIEMKTNRGVNVRAINLSGGGLTGGLARAVFQALEDVNILFVHSAGNASRLLTDETVDPLAPILIRVASIDRSGEPSHFSNLGSVIHLAAPGGNIPTLAGRIYYAIRNHPALLLVNRGLSENFDPWSVQPPESWTVAQTELPLRNYRYNLPVVTLVENFIPMPSVGIWYQSTPAETTLTFPRPIALRGYKFEDILFQINLKRRLTNDTFLTLELGTGTSLSVTWHPWVSWFGATPIFVEHGSHPPSMFGHGSFQDASDFWLRFRTTPSIDPRDFVILDSIAVQANPPIPQFSDIPENRVDSYFPAVFGTSFAAPYVAGVAALVWAHRPELSAAQVQSVITNPENLDPLPCVITKNLPCVTSQGTLNAFKILTAITTAEVSILGPNEIVTQPNQTYTFPVRLHRAPGVFNTATERVVFETEISYRLNDEMIVHSTSLTFTLDNWYQPQSITLTNQAGALGNGLFVIPDSDQRIIVAIRLQASESPDSDPDFAMTTAEKHICLQKSTGQPLILGLCRLTGLEGEPIAYHLTLSQRPDSTLTLSIAVMPRTAGNVSPAQLTFTPDNWNTPQTLIVHPDQVDLLRNIPQRLTLQATLSDTSSDLISSITQTVTLLDNQTSPTLVFAPRTPFLLTGFSTQTLTLRLGGQAASEVQVSLASEPRDLLKLSPNTLRFTPQNWNQVQTIFLRTQRVGTFPTTITAQVDANLSDPQYHGVTAVLPGLIRTQDLRILGLSDQTLVEGTSYDYALMLSATPNQTIHINPVVEPSDAAVFIPQTLTFTPDNWNTTQTLSVRAAVDFHNTTNRIARITLNGIPSHLMLPATSHLTITDSDESIPDFVVQPEQLRLQDGRSQTLSIRLNGNPDDRLDVALVSSHPQWVHISPTTITFTPQNWFEPQRFSVLAPDFVTTHTIVTAQADRNSPDTVFRAALKQVPVIVDRRAIKLAGFEDRTVVEGAEHTYQLSLSTTPASAISLTVRLLRSPRYRSRNAVSFSTTSITFNENDWNIPKPLTVRAIPQIYEDKVRITPIALENTLGQLAETGVRFLTILDDGRRPGPVGVVVEPPSNFFVADGHSSTFNITLAGQPLFDVPLKFDVFAVLEHGSFIAQAFQVKPSYISFTVDNWNIPRSVEITSTLRSHNTLIRLRASLVDIFSTDYRYGDPFPLTIGTIYPPLEIIGLTNRILQEGKTISYDLEFDQIPPAFISTYPNQSSPVSIIVSSNPPNAVHFEPEQIVFAQGRFSPPQKLTLTPRPDLFQKQQRVLLHLTPSEKFVRKITQSLSVARQLPQLLSDPSSSLSIGRQGQQNQVSFYLDEQPENPITLDLSTDNPDFIVSPARFNFTSINWNTRQTATVVASLSTTTVANLNLVADSADPNSPFYKQTKTLSLHPLHLLGLESLQIEEGGSHTYQLYLTSAPHQTMTLIPELRAPENIAFFPPSISFSPHNWSTSQSWTVQTPVNPSSSDEYRVSIRFSDVSAQLLSTPTATLTVSDNGLSAGLIMTPASLSFDKTMQEGVVSISLSKQPQSNVVVMPSITNHNFRIVPASLSFTSADWNRSQTVTIRVSPNYTGAEVETLLFSIDDAQSDSQYHGLTQTLTLHPLQLLGLTDQVLTEGSRHTYSLRLTTTPTQTMTLTPGIDLPETLSFDPQQLVFTQDNWDLPQEWTVSTPRDFINVPDHAINITLVDTPAQLLTTPTATIEVRDTGQTATLTIVSGPNPSLNRLAPLMLQVQLAGQPHSDVVFTLSIANRSIAVTPETLTFTPDNWNQPQQVTARILPGYTSTETQTLLFSVDDTQSDSQFHGLTQTLALQPLHLLGISDESLVEGDDFTNYNVQLTARPPRTMVLTPVIDPPGALIFSPPQLFFHPNDQSSFKTWRVRAFNDLLNNQDRTARITFVDTPSQLLTTPTAIFEIRDIGQTASFITTPRTSLFFDKSGPQSLQIQLTGQPQSNVVVVVFPFDFDTLSMDSSFTIAPDTLTFTPANWNQPQTVFITASIQSYSIETLVISVRRGSDSQFGNLTRMLTLHPLQLLGLTDQTLLEGNEHTYSLQLTTAPGQTITLTPNINPPGALTLEPQQLVFTQDNWDTHQELTVRAPRNSLNNQDRVARLMLVDSSAQLLATPTATIEIRDDGQTAAVIVVVPDSKLSLNKLTPLILQVRLAGQPQSTVVLTLSIADNAITVTPAVLTFTPSNWNQPQPVSLRTASQTSASTNTTLTITVDNARSDMQFHHVVRELQVTVQVRSRLRVRVFLEGPLQ